MQNDPRMGKRDCIACICVSCNYVDRSGALSLLHLKVAAFLSGRGGSKSFEAGYLGLYLWAEKCCMNDLLTLISIR